MSNLQLSYFDEGIASLHSEECTTIPTEFLLSEKCKKVLFAGCIAHKPLIFAIWDPCCDEIKPKI